MRDGPPYGAVVRPHRSVELPAKLMVWLSPSFPVGAFAYSHGLELATSRGWIADRDGLEAWLGDLVRLGSLRNDLILLHAAYRAVVATDVATLRTVNEMALALQPSAERHLETVSQGDAFAAAVRGAWPAPGLARSLDAVAEPAGIAYPVAVGIAAAAHGIPVDGTLFAHGLAFVSALVSAAIRLSLIGHSDGQRIVAILMDDVAVAASAAVGTTLDDLGGASLRADLASLLHETLYSRLFRS